MENGLEQQVLAKAQKWLDGNYDAETKIQFQFLQPELTFYSCMMFL